MVKNNSNSQNTGHILEGETTEDVLKKVWETIKVHGKNYKGQRGTVRSIKGVTLIVNNPLDEKKAYPYWDKKSDNWYQDNFVRKETNKTPESLATGDDIYSYKYVDRSRYYDSGIGYTLGVIKTLQKLEYKTFRLKTQKDIEELLIKSYSMYHPEKMLSVIHWMGRDVINYYLKDPKFLKTLVERSRRDSLLSVIEEIRNSPTSRRAITPSFTYEQIDHSGAAGGVPVYQNYQLYVDFNENGTPKGLISFHLHRALDAYGGAQLDISHDRDWGALASQMIALPLLKIVIYTNDIWEQLPDENSSVHLQKKTDIRSWLFSVTDGYDPKIEDIEKRLASPIYKAKIATVMSKL